MSVDYEDILLLVRLGDEAGGRVDPAPIMRRPKESTSRQAFEAAKTLGYLDPDGYVTARGAAVSVADDALGEDDE